MTKFSYDDILAINKFICEQSGEQSIVIKESDIRGALSVQDSYYETDEEIRAALFHHLIASHGFEDANKRTAMVVLLYDGGINISQQELISIALEVAGPGGSRLPIDYLVSKIFNKYTKEN